MSKMSKLIFVASILAIGAASPASAFGGRTVSDGCAVGKVRVQTASGGTTCVVPATNWDECVQNSLNNRFPRPRAEKFCDGRFRR